MKNNFILLTMEIVMILKRLVLYCFLFISCLQPFSHGCTRVLWSKDPATIVVGRTMNWEDSTEPEFWVFPRGTARKGGQNPMAKTWISRHGNIVISAYGKVIVDGVNEKGLAGHALYFGPSDYGSTETNTPFIESGLWLQYILDQYATVQEAVDDASNWHLVLSHANGHKAALHIAIEDQGGDSAIIEYIDGKPQIYHGRQYKVLANTPSYDQHLMNLENYYRGDLKNVQDKSGHFIQASVALSDIPLSGAPIHSVNHILDKVSVNAPDSTTYYKSIIDLSKRAYYFYYLPMRSQLKSQFWIDLKNIDFSEEGRVLHLDPTNPDLKGEISPYFRGVSGEKF